MREDPALATLADSNTATQPGSAEPPLTPQEQNRRREEQWLRDKAIAREARNAREQRARTLLEELGRRFPAVFSKPVPLKLGVTKELRALLQHNEPFGGAGEVSWAVLKLALAYWTGRRGYQEALAAGTVRYGLNGEIAGEVTDTER